MYVEAYQYDLLLYVFRFYLFSVLTSFVLKLVGLASHYHSYFPGFDIPSLGLGKVNLHLASAVSPFHHYVSTLPEVHRCRFVFVLCCLLYLCSPDTSHLITKIPPIP